TKSDGSKFGKTESGNVWLDPRRTSPYEFFQYWIRTADAEVGSYLRYFTFLDHEAIEELDRATASHPERREAQRVLAREVTASVHGAEEAARAERAALVLFTPHVTELDEETLATSLTDAPSSPVDAAELDAGLPLVDALRRTGLAKSRSEARRQVRSGGISINNVRESAEDRRLGRADVLHGRYILLRHGHTQSVLVVGS
ncbi:MAG TPA: S4 domain-containing protein, partial [Acidimicrobiales bacterium]|nr:S4 domain-containing protein [Acidimicrobiales bacterium]